MWAPGAAQATQVVTLRSAPLAVYATALREFKDAYGRLVGHGAQKTIAPVQYTDLLLTELGEGAVARIASARPDLIVTVGQRALESAGILSGVPIVHLMAVRVPTPLQSRSEVQGVSMEVPPEQWVEAFARAMPGRRRVGIVYDPRHTSAWVERAGAVAGLVQIRLVAEPVDSSRAVPAALDRLRGAVDALWMIPDLTAITPQTVELLSGFSLEERVPVFSFAEKYLAAGATAAFLLSPEEVGRRGAELALQATGSVAVKFEVAPTPRVVMRVNPRLAARFLMDAPSQN